jgi:hypothetical protein
VLRRYDEADAPTPRGLALMVLDMQKAAAAAAATADGSKAGGDSGVTNEDGSESQEMGRSSPKSPLEPSGPSPAPSPAPTLTVRGCCTSRMLLNSQPVCFNRCGTYEAKTCFQSLPFKSVNLCCYVTVVDPNALPHGGGCKT